MEPGESCRKCTSCKEGHYERCPEMIFAGTSGWDVRDPSCTALTSSAQRRPLTTERSAATTSFLLICKDAMGILSLLVLT